MKNIFIFFSLIIFITSCIPKKKFLTQKTIFQNSRDSLQRVIQSLEFEKDTFGLALAFEKGANFALLKTQDRLQDRLDVLQLDIDKLGSNASNKEQQLFADIQQKEKEIQELEQTIDEIQQIINDNKQCLKVLAEGLQPFFSQIKTDSIELRQRAGQLVIAIGENALFRPSSTSKLTEEGKELLNEISDKIQQYPEMKVWVVGHTDNQDVNRQSLDNWQYSALRAVSIVKYFLNETDLSTSRLIASSKSQFTPLQSNETKEGRARNRRIEIIITPPVGFLEQKIIRTL